MKASKKVFNYLTEKGLNPQVQDDTIIYFTYQGLPFVYFIEDEDSRFFRLALPGLIDVTEDNLIPVLHATNEVNCNVKAVKLLVLDDDVWAASELLLDSSARLDDLLPRCIDLLMNSRQAFFEAMK